MKGMKKTSFAKTASILAIAAMIVPSIASAQDDEIYVTATKRAEKLSEVPIAISVFGDQDVDQTGIRELSELAEYIPNVQISGHTDFRSVVTIRGVGSSSRNIGFDSRVGVYLDGVYLGQSPSVNQELLDLERVEVLRGPQGMLFGKNTVAGAISLITKKPADEFSARVTADIGNLDYREFKGIVNIPLAENVAAKLSVSKTDRDGYIDNITTGNDLNTKDVLAYRGQLRITPSEKLELNFSFDGLEADNRILVGEPLSDMLGIFPVQVAPEPRTVAFDFDPSEDRSLYGGSADVEYKFDNGFVLKSITGYRNTDATYRNVTDYSPVSVIFIDYTDKFEQTTEELQLISPGGERLNYMFGLYYYNQDADTVRDVTLGSDFHEAFIAPFVAPVVAPLLMLDPNNLTPDQLALIASVAGFGPEGSKVFNRGTVKTESFAGYFNGSYELSDRWKLGFGGRYSVENKDVNWLLDGRNSGSFNIGSTNYDPMVGGNPSPLINDRTDKFFSPAISLSYQFENGTNVYGKYSSGYKSGGFNLDYINADELAANSGLEFDKETVDSYEIGAKGTLFDGRMSLNLAAFIANYDNYQVNQFVDLGGGRTSIRITNAASVETKGVEAEFKFDATENLNIYGSAGYLDATFDSFVGGGAGGADASGNRLVNAPEFTGAIGGVYTKPVPSLHSTLLVRADLTHTGDYFTTADSVTTTTLRAGAQVPFGHIDEVTLLNGRIGLITDNECYEVYLWGRNLTDEDYLVDDFRDFFGTIVNHPAIGKTYGIGLVANF